VDATLVSRLGPTVDIAHVFAARRAELARELKRLRSKLRSDAATWVSWPKKASKVPTDITEDVIRAGARAALGVRGYQGVRGNR
jgi:hypothetical protein